MALLPPAPARADPGSFLWASWNNQLRRAVQNFYVKAGPPTVDQIPPGQWALFKDTTGGTLKIYANDGGTIKSVTLT